MIEKLRDKVLNGNSLSQEDARWIATVEGVELFDLLSAANRIRNVFRGDEADLCSIVNAKSGACPEDCSYCAQSSNSSADIPVYTLINKDIVLERARDAKMSGVKRFCIVTSGRRVGRSELAEIASMLSAIRKMGLLPCATLGLLNEEELSLLKDAGLERFHHNVETSERFFPEICRTHSYQDKIRTIRAVRSVGLSLCSGGIFGMGETWQDRIDVAFALKELNADSVPINFLIPIKGTPLGNMDIMHPFEALKIISLYRFILPEKEIRICGGRMQVLGELNSMVFMAGADGLLTGDYLTTTGRTFEDDLKLIRQYGMKTV